MSLLAETKKFKGLWYRRVYDDPPVRCFTLQNMSVNEDGQLQARRGTQKPAPNGGSGLWDASSPPVTGSTTSMGVGAHDRVASRFYVMRKTAAGVFSEDLSNQTYFPAFNAAAVNEELWFVSPTKFSTVLPYIGLAAANLTISWFYTSPAGLQALGTVTNQLNVTGLNVISFSPPTTGGGFPQNWGANYVNGYLGFALVARITVVGGGPVIPRFARNRIEGDAGLRRDLIVATSDTIANPNRMKIWRYAPDDTTTITRFKNVDNGAGTGLMAGNDAPVRFSSHDGVVYAVNGMVQRRIPGDPAQNADIGFPAPTGTLALAPAAPVGAGMTGIYLYAITAAFGPNGRWGESSPLFALTGGGAFNPVGPLVAQDVTVTLPAAWIAGLSTGIVDRIYLYKSEDLTGAAANAVGLQPLYLQATIDRADTTGAFPATYVDSSATYPINTRHLDIRDRTPPSRCKFAVFTKGRLVLGGNVDYPARVWPSLIGEYEAFDQQNEYQDFTNQASGSLMGMIEFNDWLVVFTERSTHVLTNLDQDDWGVQTVLPETGCIAPDSIQVAYGRLFWLGIEGVWMWDGVNPPENISWPLRLEQCSSMVHGASRAITYNYGYEIELIPADRLNSYTTEWPSTTYGFLWTKYFFNVRTREWNQVQLMQGDSAYLQPIASVTYPIGSKYAGRRCPLYMRHRYGGGSTDLTPYLGDAGSVDGGVNDLTGTAITMQLGLIYAAGRSEIWTPNEWQLDVDNISSFVATHGGAVIGHKAAIDSTPETDAATEYTMARSRFTEPGSGASAMQLMLTGTMSGEGLGRVFNAYLYGEKEPRLLPG